MQRLSVGASNEHFCRTKWTMMHELGHAMGFWHEQTRPDRDSYIRIVEENIMEGFEDQFVKYNRNKVDSLGVPYDYQSIMHYSDKVMAPAGHPGTKRLGCRGFYLGSKTHFTLLH